MGLFPFGNNMEEEGGIQAFYSVFNSGQCKERQKSPSSAAWKGVGVRDVAYSHRLPKRKRPHPRPFSRLREKGASLLGRYKGCNYRMLKTLYDFLMIRDAERPRLHSHAERHCH